jgi:hypothetical protein
VRNKTISVPDGATQASATSACLAGEIVLGGGVRLFDPTWSITASFPAQSGSTWLWVGAVSIPSGSGSFVVSAVCLTGTSRIVNS